MPYSPVGDWDSSDDGYSTDGDCGTPACEVIDIDNEWLMGLLICTITELRGHGVRVYIDLEGNNLSRMGTIDVFQVYLEKYRVAYLIDVTTLGRRAFETVDFCPFTNEHVTFKDILEDVRYTKVLFDLRNDSDAMFGLRQCKATKDYGKRLFRDGDYRRYAIRPLAQKLRIYCANDVCWLPTLRKAYLAQGYLDSPLTRKKVIWETEQRVKQSQAATYHKHRNEGPRSWNKYEHPEYPATLRTNDGPDWPNCYCGRYQGMRHHCEEQCTCYQEHCRWWIDRAPPTVNGTPAGPLYNLKWGANIPRLDVLDIYLPGAHEGGSFRKFHATSTGRHLDYMVGQLKQKGAEYRQRKQKGKAPEGRAMIAHASLSMPKNNLPRSLGMVCKDPDYCRAGMHTGCCYAQRGYRTPGFAWNLWTEEPPRTNPWKDPRRTEKLRLCSRGNHRK